MKIVSAILKACLLVSFVGLIADCSTMDLRVPVESGSNDYNLAAEKIQNEMLLLNIVRAYKNYPMYFTLISDIKGSYSYTLGTGTLNIPFAKYNTGPYSTSFFTIGPTLAYTANPIADVVVLNTKEFTQGMLTPIKPDVLYYYWQQGWPKKMLLNLFVGHITFERIKETNNPRCGQDQVCGFGEFAKEVQETSWDKCEFVTQKPEVDVGPPMEDSKAKDLKGLVKTQEAGLDLSKTDDKYQLSSPQEIEYFLKCPATGKYPELGESDYYYSFAGTEPQSVGKTKSGNIVAVKKAEKTITIKGDDMPFDATDAAFGGGYNGIGDVTDGDRVIVRYREKDDGYVATSVSRSTRVMDLRSPEAILYYLGEVMRSGTAVTMKYEYSSRCKETSVYLFSARKGDAGPGEKKPPVKVTYENENYVIPYVKPEECTSDESMHVLSLMSLLIAKQQSAGQLPAPVGVTTTIGK